MAVITTLEANSNIGDDRSTINTNFDNLNNDKVETSAIGTIASQDSDAINITGGSISGITDLAITDGGTGASDASTAFNNIKQDASTTSTGVVELATEAEAVIGTTGKVADSELTKRQAIAALWHKKLDEGYFDVSSAGYLRGQGGIDFGLNDFTVAFVKKCADISISFDQVFASHSSGDERITISRWSDGQMRTDFISASGDTNYFLNIIPYIADDDLALYIFSYDRDMHVNLFVYNLTTLSAWGTHLTQDISAKSGVDFGNGNSNPHQWCNDADVQPSIFKPLFAINGALSASEVDEYVNTLQLPTAYTDLLSYQKPTNNVQIQGALPAEGIGVTLYPQSAKENTVEIVDSSLWSAASSSIRILNQDLLNDERLIAEWYVKSTSSQAFNFGDESNATRYDSAFTVGTTWTKVSLDAYGWDGTNGELRVAPTASFTGTLYHKIKLLDTNG